MLASGPGGKGRSCGEEPSPAGMQNAVLACPAQSGGGAGGDGEVGGAGGGPGAGVVMVKRAALVACLTCPLCGRLLRDAATITECLHTCEFPPTAPSLPAPRFVFSLACDRSAMWPNYGVEGGCLLRPFRASNLRLPR